MILLREYSVSIFVGVVSGLLLLSYVRVAFVSEIHCIHIVV